MQLHRLSEFLELIDSKLNDIDLEISSVSDPESEGLFDRGEYFVGIGFVAIQQCLNEALIGISLVKKHVLSLGPVHSTGVSTISIINAAANWWKHESEWFKAGNVPKNGEYTVSIIMNVSTSYDYALSNVLASFSSTKSLSFTEGVIPCFREWLNVISRQPK